MQQKRKIQETIFFSPSVSKLKNEKRFGEIKKHFLSVVYAGKSKETNRKRFVDISGDVDSYLCVFTCLHYCCFFSTSRTLNFTLKQ